MCDARMTMMQKSSSAFQLIIQQDVVPLPHLLLTVVAPQVLLEVGVLLELFPAYVTRKFPTRIINAVSGGAVTLRQHEVGVRLLVAGEVGIGEETFLTDLAVIWSLP